MNSTYWLNKVMSTMYTNGSGSFYIGLSSTKPSKDGNGVTEPSGNNYARVKIASFTEPNNGVVKNATSLYFPKSTGVWFDSPPAAYWVLFDGSGSSAHVLSCGDFYEPKSIKNNTLVSIASGELSITLTDYSPEISI